MSLPHGVLRTSMGVYVLNEDTCLSRWIENENRLDLEMNITEIQSFAHLIPEGGVVVDAGANIGDHAITYSQIVGSLGVVYAFEPHPLAYKALVLNMARFRNVNTFELGLSDRRSRQSFTLDPNSGASYVSDKGITKIDVVALDEFLLPRLLRCDFVHLDAEGLEPRILRGARKLIDQFHPVLVVEVCDKHLRRAGASEVELLELLHEMGYRVEAIPSHIEPELRDVICLWGTA